VVVSTRGVLAEALLNQIKLQARGTPATPEEVERVTNEHWLDLDRPEAHRTVHAVVRVTQSDGAPKVKAAWEVARHVAAAVKDTKDPNRFLDAANQVPRDGFEVVAEMLGPVTADGRVADLEHRPEPGKPPDTFAPEFVAAVWRLKAVGDQLGPVQSSFGWHVIMLTEIQPAQQYPAEERARLLWEEIVARRAREVLDRELKQLQGRTPVSVERNAETLMQLVASPPREPSQ
jgi:hypothetical protein